MMPILRSLPAAWYVLAFMTVMPSWCHIPRDLAPVFLAAYCTAAGALLLRTPPRKKKPDDKGAGGATALFSKVTID